MMELIVILPMVILMLAVVAATFTILYAHRPRTMKADIAHLFHRGPPELGMSNQGPGSGAARLTRTIVLQVLPVRRPGGLEMS